MRLLQWLGAGRPTVCATSRQKVFVDVKEQRDSRIASVKGAAGPVDQLNKALESTLQAPLKSKRSTQAPTYGAVRCGASCASARSALAGFYACSERQQLRTLAGLHATYIAVYPQVRHPGQLVAAAAAAELAQCLVLG